MGLLIAPKPLTNYLFRHRIWDMESGACISTLQGHNNKVCAVAISFDNKKVVSGSFDYTVR